MREGEALRSRSKTDREGIYEQRSRTEVVCERVGGKLEAIGSRVVPANSEDELTPASARAARSFIAHPEVRTTWKS